MHSKVYSKVFLLLLIFLIAACQTQRQAEQPPTGAKEPPKVSMRPAPGTAETQQGKVESMILPLYPEQGGRPPTPEQVVELYLSNLSLPQKVGQRFLTGVPGTKVGKKVKKLIEQGYLGGIMLTRRNIQSREQVTSFTADLQEASQGNSPAICLLIAVDQEGGRVNRLELDTLTRFPAPFYWGEYRDPHYVEAVAYITGREALSVGCNINFAPVLDLFSVPDDSIVGDRSLGANAVQVGEQGVYYLFGARRAGIASVVKHFPGHGRTDIDSHNHLPVVDVDERTLINEDLIPFQIAIRHGVDAVMTAHILYPQIDPDYPATLSAKIIKGLLRERLNFEGVVISDDIEMGALRDHYTVSEILKASLNAGVDIILEYGTLDVLKLIEEVLALVEAGEVTSETIDEGVRRILRLKLKYGLL